MANLKAAVISLGSVSSDMLVEKLKEHFDHVEHIDLKQTEIRLGKSDFTVLYKGKPLEKFDCIYVKGSFRYVDLLTSIVTILHKETYIPTRPDSFNVCHDKLLTHLALQEHKVPNPQTYLFSSVSAAKAVLQTLQYPIVMKLPHGTHGKGVIFADSPESASSMLDTLHTLKQPFIVQEYIETGGVDIRAIVVGDEVAACMQRKAALGEKRANIHAGGSGEAIQLDEKAKKIAVAAAQAVGCDICAIDILKGPKGYTVLEVNISPGLQGITRVTGLDVAGKLAKFLHDKTVAFKAEKASQSVGAVKKELGLEGKPDVTEVIAHPDFRGERLLVPEIASQLAQFKATEDLVFKAQKGKIVIKRLEEA